MRKFLSVLCVFFTSILLSTTVYAQTPVLSDPTFSTLKSDYSKHHLYRGHGFVPFLRSVTGSPNYADRNLIEGSSLVYDGVYYLDIPLMYDLTTDLLISRHPDHSDLMVLEKHLITEFSLENNLFVRIEEGHRDLPGGFYQQIHKSDRFVCYAKRIKVLETHTYGSVSERSYRSSVTFYLNDLSTNNGFRVVKRQSALLRLDKEKRGEVRRLLNSSGLQFRIQPEMTLSVVLAYLDDSN